ncbi:hybrid sensor histidine kinase/response regulator [Methylibium rhizosphaerae]|uniref:hybrid sensor histidine kinase/response regulator n=1 Tax=Methylibium rhizosphaerae TaxID=2570323 RepID=UPI0011297C8F|nr:ATP-binding protein [Methylibium rhizosphaerae]
MESASFTAESAPSPPAPVSGEAVQRVIKIRRDYNSWVARETMEDYALRFTPRAFRKWSELRVANTAFGAASFLVLEAVGATLLVQYGFINAFWAIVATGLIIFLAGLPISHYAARHGVDMDLLTRGAGFGYIGSTITSLIYASFTFIFFALEAAIMAYALELAFDIPPALGYLICALVVIPLVTHGVTVISRLQVWTQPLWLVLLVLPFVYVLKEDPQVLAGLVGYGGDNQQGGRFDLHLFGAAMTVGIALITQMGEQVDYLRFMPERTGRNRMRWLAGMLIGGPGWVVLGVAKMLGGALLAYLAISHSVPPSRAVDPNQMYLAAYEYVFPTVGWAVAATTVFVVISQLKINVTNAYAGSLAWSNFFSRLTHSHPGRVVWVVFNTLIALMLMELEVFQALGGVLGLYSNIAISWMMAVVADLVVNKPLGLSPKGIEFKRAHLYDVNPVGVGAMGMASVLSVAAHLGVFGPGPQAFSAAIAMVTAFVTAPLIAWWTKGRYYIARRPETPGGGAQDGPYLRLRQCVICDREYETDDMAHCPAYQGPICSLCCSLDARCDDLCKPDARLSVQWNGALRAVLPRAIWPYLDTGLGHYLLVMAVVVPLLGLLLGLMYYQELRVLGEQAAAHAPGLKLTFVKVYAALLLVAGIVAWWLVLTHKSRQVAQEESNRQTHLLMREIESHKRTDLQLQHAKRDAERAQHAAELANQAKSRYITNISHELRTPLNSILGYAQLLEEDEAMPPRRRQAVGVIRRGGDHLLSLIEGTLDIARIEGGKLTLDVKPMRFRECVEEIARMFELQASAKAIDFRHDLGELPAVVRADEKRLRQILINVLGNAVKFTGAGHVAFRVHYSGEMARFEIEDSGPGMSPQEMEHIFEPFVRGSAHTGGSLAGGSGLGLTISKMLTDLMGGEMTVSSTPGVGTLFRIKLFLPQVRAAVAERELPRTGRTGYAGARRRVLVVDNEEVDRELLASVLQPLGFELQQAANGEECLALLEAGLAPDVILMDLAMPGLDGWGTLRQIRLRGLSSAPVAIVSANAFDKGLENDVGIRAEDFIVKPVRVSELLDWLGARLSLQWQHTAPPPPAAPAVAKPAAQAYPPAQHLRALEELVNLGYFRGIVSKLDEIEAAHPDSTDFVTRLRLLARGFQLEAMSALIQQALPDVEPTA